MRNPRKALGASLCIIAFLAFLVFMAFFFESAKDKVSISIIACYLFYALLGGFGEIVNGNMTFDSKLIHKFLSGFFSILLIAAIYPGIYFLLVTNLSWYNEVWTVISKIISACCCAFAAIYYRYQHDS